MEMADLMDYTVACMSKINFFHLLIDYYVVNSIVVNHLQHCKLKKNVVNLISTSQTDLQHRKATTIL